MARTPCGPSILFNAIDRVRFTSVSKMGWIVTRQEGMDVIDVEPVTRISSTEKSVLSISPGCGGGPGPWTTPPGSPRTNSDE